MSSAAPQPRCPGCGLPMREIDGAWECMSCNEILTPTSPIRLPKLDGSDRPD